MAKTYTECRNVFVRVVISRLLCFYSLDRFVVQCVKKNAFDSMLWHAFSFAKHVRFDICL